MVRLILFLFVLSAISFAQTSDTTGYSDTFNSRGQVDRPLAEKSPKKFRPISKGDTVVLQVVVNYKGGGSANIMRMVYGKSEKSDSSVVDGVPTRMTTVLRNVAWVFGEVPCDTCSRR